MMTDPTGQGRYANAAREVGRPALSGGIFFHEADWTNISGTSTDCRALRLRGTRPRARRTDASTRSTRMRCGSSLGAGPPDARTNVVRLTFDDFAPETVRCRIRAVRAWPVLPGKTKRGTDATRWTSAAVRRVPERASACLYRLAEDESRRATFAGENGERPSFLRTGARAASGSERRRPR